MLFSSFYQKLNFYVVANPLNFLKYIQALSVSIDITI